MTIELANEWFEYAALTVEEAALLLALRLDPKEHKFRLDHDDRYSDYFYERDDAQESVQQKIDVLINNALGGGLIQITDKAMKNDRIDPMRTLISKKSLIEWCDRHGYADASIALKLTLKRKVSNQATAVNAETHWTEHARRIATELRARDRALGCHDSLRNYSERVMEELRMQDIEGPRGPITNPNTVMREALQGQKWWKAPQQ